MANTVRFLGCLHLGHTSMAYYRGFNSSDEHDDYLIKQWNNTVGYGDITYILGDITMETSKYYYKLDLLKGIKHVILGNHDRRQDVRELLNYVDSVGGMVDYKGYTLTHCPIHPNEISFSRGNIHAHIHHMNKLEEVNVAERFGDESKVQYPTLNKYYNVDAYLLDFKPKTLEELINDN